ncbi:MAG: ubiquinol-cytochrome c reductase iron-sulfur subunit [Acidobacteriota bacterium]|jgi:cytochrome b6-f complex iron-sulfur subunit|nr:Cytochrome b6-f complex iron-sulfur subunit [bacterium HR09]
MAESNRREFLVNLILGLSVIPGFAWAARHVLQYLVPPKSQRTTEVLLTRLSDLPVGSGREFKGVLGNDLIAARLPSGDVRVFSSICTHLGCHVQWDQVAGNFLCPCHLGRFDTEGKVLAGPPPTPLPSFAVRVSGNDVYVTVPVKEG